ncbi:MFS transporter [Streptomyces montanisoli]|uniref:MFS transporter n=1 Tax=Streptomyces montanisoli TaxID=2798581 RepID=A0A940M5M9_9ACTN|nr:MFS transporter [Streptomyces montanisoli]MBP0456585.1 MFS transporter [Streptomyces montanisoli]
MPIADPDPREVRPAAPAVDNPRGLPLSRGRRAAVLLVLCVSLFMAMLDNTVVNVALPSVQNHLDAGISDLQWIVDGYSLSLAALMLTAGTVGDLYGRRRVFLLGLLLFGAGSAVSALAGHVALLIAGRVLQGAGAAAFMPGTLSIIRQVYTDERERATAIGVWAGVSGLGLGLGPIVGGPIVDHFGWRWVFWLNVPIALFGIVAGRLLVPESSDRAGRTLDPGGQLLAVVGVGAAVYATIEGPARGWGDAWVVGGYAVAAVALPLFVLVEHRVRSPLLDLRLFRDRLFSGALLNGLLLYLGMFSVLYFLSLWLQEVLGWSATGAGLVVMPAMVVVAAVTPLAGWIAGRFGAGYPMTAGLLVSAFAMAGMAQYGVGASLRSYWWLLPVIGLGMGLVLTPITATALARVPARRAGMASAAANTLRELGGVVGVAALGSTLTAAMHHDLSARLTALGLGTGERAHFLAQLHGGTRLSDAGLPAAVAKAANASYVRGLHVAEYSGAAVLLVGCLVSLVLVGRGRLDSGGKAADDG